MEVKALFALVRVHLLWLCSIYVPCAEVLLLVFLRLFLHAQVLLVPLLPIVWLNFSELHQGVHGMWASSLLKLLHNELAPFVPGGICCIKVLDIRLT